jgi:hypothetical protein
VPVDAAKTTLVGVLGEDPLTSRILGLLLAQEGYEARTLDGTAVVKNPSAALAGVDLVLLVPGFGDERKGKLVGAVKGDPATAAVPVVALSSVLETDHLDERTDSVPWPWSTEALVRAVERAMLTPAPGGGDEASS